MFTCEHRVERRDQVADAGESRIAQIGHSDLVAGYVRIITFVASVVGPVLLGVGSWAAGQAYTAFQSQRDKLEEVRLSLSTMNAQRQAVETSLSTAWDALRRQDGQLLDHERRLSHVEATVAAQYRQQQPPSLPR